MQGLSTRLLGISVDRGGGGGFFGYAGDLLEICWRSAGVGCPSYLPTTYDPNFIISHLASAFKRERWKQFGDVCF